MDIKLYAAILLVARLISMGFIFAVIVKQLALFKLPFEREEELSPEYRKKLKYYRATLFVLAITAFVGNLLPAGIDVLTIFADLDRTSRTVKPISLVYTMTWAIISIVTNFLIWRLYYLSKQVDNKVQTKSPDHTLMNNKKQRK